MTHIASLPETVGERIVWARKRKGISQVRLAEMIGTSQRHISRLENGEHLPKEPMRDKLGAALDQDPGLFESDEDDEEADGLMSLSLDEILMRRVDYFIAKRERERVLA